MKLDAMLERQEVRRIAAVECCVSIVRHNPLELLHASIHSLHVGTITICGSIGSVIAALIS
jgi:hypothetical protein